MSRKTRNLLLAAALAALLGACSGPSFDGLLASGKGHFAKKDYRAAVVDLKAALQQRPSSGEARFLLGQALLEAGDVVSATLELNKAAELGYAEATVVPILARAMLALGENKKITERFTQVELKDPRSSADLKTTLALAYVRQGMSEQSETLLGEALAADPTFAPARITKAAYVASRGDIDGALAIFDQVLKDDPQSRDAWQAKGEVLMFGKGDVEGATVALRKAIEIDKTHLPPYLRLFSIALGRRDMDGMVGLVKELKAQFPKYPHTQYIEAQVAFMQHDISRSRDIVLQLLKRAPDNVHVLQLAGAVEFQSRALLQAETHLAKALRLMPESPATRRLLAQVYLRSGQPDKALANLQSLLDPKRADGEALALAAEAQLQLGRVAPAEALYVRAAKLAPNNAKVRTALALTQLSKGNADMAFAELQAVASADASAYADMALIAARMRRKEYDAALKAIEALEKKMPKQAFVQALRGQAEMARGDKAAAARALEAALTIDPVYFPAAVNLARLDVAAKDTAKARQRFESVLQADPKNNRALLAIAELLTVTGAKRPEVEAVLRKAVNLNPTEPSARVALLRHFILHDEHKAALTEAQAALAALPGHLDVLEVVGQAQANAGETQQAISTYSKLAAAIPRSPQPHLRLADVYIATKDFKLATDSLNKALQVAPGLLQAQRGLIAIALNDKRYAEALSIAREVQRARPKDEVGLLLEGDIEAKRGNWEAALAAYRQGLQRARTAELASKIHTSLLSSNQRAEAERFAAGWEKAHPADVAFLFYLGDRHLAAKEFAAAEPKFRAVVKLRPDHALALNNLAVSLLGQRKPGALALATRANELLALPEIMDTLAAALLEERQTSRAMEVQRRAVELRPQSPALKLTLAKVYLQAGDNALAKAELEKLAGLGERFAGSGEAKTLLAALK